LVTDDQYAAILSLYSVIGIMTSLFGLVTNAINFKIFAVMGTKDGITVSFLFLSSAEFVCFWAALGQELSIVCGVTEILSKHKISLYNYPTAFGIYFGSIRTCLFTIPVLITLYLSVAKCVCVVRPLHFKNMFSVRTTVIIMSGICVCAVLSYLPIFCTTGIMWVHDKKTNASRIAMATSPYRDIIKNVVWTARDSVPSIASQVIVIVCIYLMIGSLRKAARFRGLSSSGTVLEPSKNSTHKNNEHEKARLGGAEVQVIKQVVVISVVYIVGNTPKIAIILASSVVPDLNLGHRFQNLYIVLTNTRELIEMIFSAVNIFIYYNYNSKFK
ncbi:unnamed protein product, partial [Lymnaea stagnalis]